MASRVTVRPLRDAGRPYDILIGERLAWAARDIVRRANGARLFLVTDSTVRRLYGRSFLRLLRDAGGDARLITVPPGERSKSRAMKSKIEDGLIASGAARDSVILALGGGVVGDLAGFAASTLHRGIAYVQIPTTLLAQVDSSVGGKVAVDHPLGKNLIGAFHRPERVYADLSTLGTLSDREFLNGIAEVIKAGAILDASLFRFLETNRSAVLARKPAALSRVVRTSCRIKRDVVELDEKEAGFRRILNFGHTIGHALERLTRYRIPHGRAVAMGMAAEARMSRALGLLPPGDLERLIGLLRLYSLPHVLPAGLAAEHIIEATRMDKKRRGSKIHYTLLERIGRARTDMALSERDALRLLQT